MPSISIAVVFLSAAGVVSAAGIPAGTQLQIRLSSALNTTTAKVNDPFQAIVIAPVMLDGQIAMVAGAKVSGHIKEVTAAVKPDDQAALTLLFDRISGAAGKPAPLAAKLASVDNARETVDADGRILGIIAAQTGAGRMDQGINKVAAKYPGLADLLGTIKGAVVKDTDANIDYEPGAEMTIELTKPLQWVETAPLPAVSSIQPEDALSRLVNHLPFLTYAVKPPKPSDLTNLLFLGSQQDLENAFAAAGWSPAESLNSKSKLETFRAMTEQRGYKEAPVSILLLGELPPDLVFEKQNDTFNARHHLRVWRQAGEFNGKAVWACAATHDIGIDFSQQNMTFIHKIDSMIDRERAKVVNDLMFTGLVHGLSLVDRPNVPRKVFNATGDAVETDGMMAVVSF